MMNLLATCRRAMIVTLMIRCFVSLEPALAESDPVKGDSAEAARPVAAMLKQRADEFAQRVPPEVLAAGQQGLDELIKSGIAESALQVGAPMPAFELPDAHGKLVKSEDLLAGGPLVIVFYRGAWCPYCNLYLGALQGYLPDFESLGATLVAISGEPPDRSLEVEQKDSLAFPVLSDTALVASRKFGIVYQVPEVTDKLMLGFGLDLKTYYGAKTAELPLSATYVVNRDGMIVYAFLEPDYKLRAEPADILAALRHAEP